MSLRKFLIDVATDEEVRRAYVELVQAEYSDDDAKRASLVEWFDERRYQLDADHRQFLLEGKPLKLERVRLDVQGTFEGSPQTYIHIIWDVPIIW